MSDDVGFGLIRRDIEDVSASLDLLDLLRQPVPSCPVFSGIRDLSSGILPGPTECDLDRHPLHIVVRNHVVLTLKHQKFIYQRHPHRSDPNTIEKAA